MTDWDTVIIGGTLAALATAARLAKNRHKVLVLEAESRLGGSMAPHPYEEGSDTVLVDRWPQIITFPAPWRDLFRKSGRPFDDELARGHHALVPAPAPRHVFDDGTELVLPTERGVQFSVLAHTFGRPVAERWRDLLDHLDEVAQALRPLGGEAELISYDQISRRASVLSPGRTVADLATAIDHPQLAMLILDTARRIGSDPARTPSWVAAQLSNERRFGRWMMTTDERPDRASLLLDLLIGRLRTRRVTVRTDEPVQAVTRTDSGFDIALSEEKISARTVVLGINPVEGRRLLGKQIGKEGRIAARTTPARSPVVSHEIATRSTAEPSETVRHTEHGPVISWTRPLGQDFGPQPDLALTSTHDWSRATASPGAGQAWRGPKSIMRRPPIRSALPGLHWAGPFSRGGEDLSHVVLSGALASYACHEFLADAAG